MTTHKQDKLEFSGISEWDRSVDGTLSHKVYRKPTHTGLYLNDTRDHHQAQRLTVLSTLVHRARVTTSVKVPWFSWLPRRLEIFLFNSPSNTPPIWANAFRTDIWAEWLHQRGKSLKQWPKRDKNFDMDEIKGCALLQYCSMIEGKPERLLGRYIKMIFNLIPSYNHCYTWWKMILV